MARLADSTSHDGAVWEVSWAHPKFGNILASASYDGKVIIWQERQGQWMKISEHANHHASGTPLLCFHSSMASSNRGLCLVNAVQWGPHELGAILACGSTDGKVSVVELREDGSWDTKVFLAHAIGCNSVS